MQDSLNLLAVLLALLTLVGCNSNRQTAHSQAPDVRTPPDFLIEGFAGGLMPGAGHFVFMIGPGGSGTLARYETDRPGPPDDEQSFEVTESEMQLLWSSVLEQGFFSLDRTYRRDDVDDGFLVELTISGDGKTHSVEVENVSVQEMYELLRVIERVLPDDVTLPVASVKPGP